MRLQKSNSIADESITKFDDLLMPQPVSNEFIRALNSKPRFSSNKEAVRELSKELQHISKRLKVSIDQLLVDAESSEIHKPLYIEALMLAREISYFSSLDE